MARTKLWVDRVAGAVLIVGVTFFCHEMLDTGMSGSTGVNGPSLRLLGALGLALFGLGLGALSVTFCRLAYRLRAADGVEVRRLVKEHLLTVAQVLAGAVLTLLYVFLRF